MSLNTFYIFILSYYYYFLKGCRVAGCHIKIYRFIVQKFMNKKLLYGLRLKTMCQPATRQPGNLLKIILIYIN